MDAVFLAVMTLVSGDQPVYTEIRLVNLQQFPTYNFIANIDHAWLNEETAEGKKQRTQGFTLTMVGDHPRSFRRQ